MNFLDDNLYVPRRTLEEKFPQMPDRDLQTTHVTVKSTPIIKNSVYWKATARAPGQMCYTGITNLNSRATYNRWLKSYTEREKKSLPPVYAVQMRETCCCDSTLPVQYPSRWRDIPIPRDRENTRVQLNKSKMDVTLYQLSSSNF
ncbi:hypothetical protein chiPu_0003697 [Chiloscyllium punctatum]|uniref:Uncharacterized protein n=1 Tax=Chiloscyllium punctatum TaxID=137246 RepID=A0A401S4H8_CHIPU|nr:hypothetical protein [Chiloscyllium punctatum]